MGAGGLGQLHGVAAHGAAGAVDEDPLPALQIRVLEQRLPGRKSDQGQRGRVRERDARRCRGEARGGGQDILGRGAVGAERQEADHRVADLQPVHALAQRVDRAGHVQSGDVRKFQRHRALHAPGPDVAVDAVERRGCNPHPHLALAGDGVVDVLHAQNLGVAVLVKTHCLHDCSSYLPVSFESEVLSYGRRASNWMQVLRRRTSR